MGPFAAISSLLPPPKQGLAELFFPHIFPSLSEIFRGRNTRKTAYYDTHTYYALEHKLSELGASLVEVAEALGVRVVERAGNYRMSGWFGPAGLIFLERLYSFEDGEFPDDGWKFIPHWPQTILSSEKTLS